MQMAEKEGFAAIDTETLESTAVETKETYKFMSIFYSHKIGLNFALLLWLDTSHRLLA